MDICPKHAHLVQTEIAAWGLEYMSEPDDVVRHFKFRQEATRQYPTMDTMDAMHTAFKVLERLLEAQTGYMEALDEVDGQCCVCHWGSDELVRQACHAAATKVRFLRGKPN